MNSDHTIEGNKVIYVGGFELPDINAAAHRVVSNCRILEEIGYDVVLVGISRINLNGEIKKIKNIGQCESYVIPYPQDLYQWYKYLSSIRYLIDVCRMYKNKVSKIIVYNFPSVALLKLIKYANKNNIQLIADCTEWYGKTSNLIKRLDTEYRMRILHPKINNIICVSEYLQKYYINKRCNTVRIPTLVDKNDIKWQSDEKYENKFVRKYSYVGSPGTGGKDRLDIIIRAFYKLNNRNYKLMIVGIDKKNLLKVYPEMKTIVENLKSNLKFYGRLSHLDSIEIIKNCDFSIFIRKNEKLNNAGFPTKLSESFACGTPVISNSTSDIDKYLIDGFNGFLSIDDSIESVKVAIENSIKISDEELCKMKEGCIMNNPLDFRNFINSMSMFLN